MRTHVAEAWVEVPLQHFVDDARVLFARALEPPKGGRPRGMAR